MLADLKINKNKKKALQSLLISAGICLLLGITFIYGLGIFDTIFKVKVAVVSGILFVFILILLLKALWSLNDKSPVYELTKETGMGKTTPLSKALGTFYWKDVKGMQLNKVGGDTLLTIDLGNAEYYQTKLSKMFFKMAYDPSTEELQLSYSASEIDMSIQELQDVFQTYWKESQAV